MAKEALTVEVEAEKSGNAGAEPLFLDFKAILERIPLGRATINRLISSGKFPEPDIKIGSKIRLWNIETLKKWRTNEQS
jgi:predicted DNA-binding transcriptional regulator AlpA